MQCRIEDVVSDVNAAEVEFIWIRCIRAGTKYDEVGQPREGIRDAESRWIDPK